MLAVFSQKVLDGSSVWQTAGMAIRAAVALGLHRELSNEYYFHRQRGVPEQQKSKMNDLRSRMFWSAYGIERMNGLILGRPFSISDVDINVPVPKRTLKTEIAYQVVMLWQIQSRLSRFIYKPPRLMGTPKELEYDEKTNSVQIK